MTDRQPRAPGQYTAVVSAAEYQKLQAGESFVITLTRNDDPEVEGTPYNKASVLPDDLAAVICPDVTDPTPADALRGLSSKLITIPVPASGWSDSAPYTQKISVSSILASDHPRYGVVYTDNYEAEKEAFSYLDDMDTANGSVTFTCFEDKPEVNLTIQLEVNR